MSFVLRSLISRLLIYFQDQCLNVTMTQQQVKTSDSAIRVDVDLLHDEGALWFSLLAIKTILIVAPHPDDEILGSGRYMLKNVLFDHHICLLYAISTLISSPSIRPEEYVIKNDRKRNLFFLS